MALVIVESPNKCEKIRKTLGQGFEVISSVGHIMDLDKKKMGIDLETWTPNYVINPDKSDVVKKIKDAVKKHQDIYIATDADYEGHCISFNIRDCISAKDKNVYRVLFKTMTKPDIMAGIQNPIPFDQKAYEAQQTRRMTDRVVGFKVSPLMWGKGLRGTSAGRVQSAALKFIVDREREIKKFVEEEYWTILAKTVLGFDADFFGKNGKKFVPKDKKATDNIIGDIKGDLIVADYQNKSRTREPSAPFITATLQKEAGTKFGWTSQKVMDTAQSLFAMGQITYHRTDSTRTEPGKLVEIRDMIEKQLGKQYLAPKTILYSKDASQDAHEAIRPTYEPVPMNLSGDELKLLDLIKAKFMASQMASAQFDQVAVKLEHQGKDKYEFRATGSVMKFDGFLKVYGSSTKDVILPQLSVGQSISVSKFIPEQHFTKAPARYTEPAFTERMEKEGIGRPATYAATIERLINHKYVVRENKSLKATEIGIMVCEYLEKHFNNLTSPTFTAKMESEVDEIAIGQLQMVPTLQKFYSQLLSDLEAAQKDKSRDLFKTEHDCPKCVPGTKMIKKISDNGIFLGCENYPTCGEVFNISEEGSLVRSKTDTGLPCPDCGEMVVERSSKWGKFLSCSSYPNCKWTGKLDANGQIAEKKKVEETGIKCDKCKIGSMVKRQGPTSTFLGCNKYPKCKNTMNLDENGNVVLKTEKPQKSAKSTGKKCPKCKKGNLVERTNKTNGNTFVACDNFPKCKHIDK